MNALDTVAIGSSPLMLLRALELARSGQRVTILDRAAVPGGGWATPALLGFTNVEAGVHLLENRPAFYKVLADDLGLDLVAEGPASFGLWRGHRINMARTRILFHSLVAAKALRRGRLDQARRIATSAARATRQLSTPFAYPAGGCAALTATLLQRLAAHGAQLILNTEIGQITVDAGIPPTCRLADGRTLTAQKLILSSRAHAPLVIDGNRWQPPVERATVHSVVLHLANVTDPHFGYVEILADRTLKRVRDITAYASPQPAPSDRLLCVQRRHDPDTDEATLGATTLAALQRLNLITNATLVATARQTLKLATIPDTALHALTRQTPQIETLASTDLADGYISHRGV